MDKKYRITHCRKLTNYTKLKIERLVCFFTVLPLISGAEPEVFERGAQKL